MLEQPISAEQFKAVYPALLAEVDQTLLIQKALMYDLMRSVFETELNDRQLENVIRHMKILLTPYN